ncbi:MAG TPA: prefoldin subunit alpha [Candidatus Bathyarchaeia archaeon]|nr:prefoldin subunit alpha [Candidatus Bathyarchaeia archaeon]
MSSSDREAFRSLSVELQILEGTAETLQARLNLVNAALTELNIARMTLEGVENESSEAPLFVPIGGGSFIKAKLESNDKVVVGTGAGVSIERTVAEAKQTLQSRIAELEKSRTAIQQQFMQVVGRIQENREKLQDLSVRLSQAGRRASVPETESRP